MDYYREFRKETLNVEKTWGLLKTYEGFQHLYLKFMKNTGLACRVLKKFDIYRKNKSRKKITLETIETIIEDNQIETINTIRKELKPVYSLKIKCKIQMQSWILDLVGIIDEGM